MPPVSAPFYFAKSPNGIYNEGMDNYKPRLADKTLERKLKGKGAVLIEGPKWCGKTTTAEQMAKSILYMSRPEDVKANLMAADINPAILPPWKIPNRVKMSASSAWR